MIVDGGFVTTPPPTPPYQQQPPLPYQQQPPPVPHPAYATPPMPPQPHPYGGPVPPGAMPGGATCEVCGAAPAAAVTVRGHQGMLVIMRFLRRQGVFCRPCGTAVFREMQADTLVQGWWGPLSAIITPFILLVNLSARSTLRALPEPTTWGWRPPLDPGKSVMRRPAGLVAAIPLAALALVVLAIPVLFVIGLVAGDDPPEKLSVGSCARNDGSWSAQDLKPEPCGSSGAEFQVTEPGAEGCPAGDYLAYPKYSADGVTTLCLHPVGR
ncbi:hypothetical protein [Streptomyces sp. NL15-2K]|uniref:LppU/SCO3897 family protein n=1 Tax=Streptomyces sp. NL15-2K TaxID=376149 RepID=UPI000FFA6309|nr:hypothetical protein [Kutzneria buriramensis]WKX12144.1 hypothetical protein Q4V64_33360 [Kutzneria buriramensis]GCB46363.1 basic proline-rich protein precursor [Streptomyces sp. NL15-2K]